jgi:hypothetical protein
MEQPTLGITTDNKTCHCRAHQIQNAFQHPDTLVDISSLVANQAQFVFNPWCLPDLQASFIDSVNVRYVSHSVH